MARCTRFARPRAALSAAALTAALVPLAGCGSAPAPSHANSSPAASAAATAASSTLHSDPTAVLLDSVTQTGATSFRADVVMDLALQLQGPAASQVPSALIPSVHLEMHIDSQSAQRMQMTLNAAVAEHQITAQAVAVDGSLYTSTDGGTRWTSQPLPQSGSLFGPGDALQFMHTVGTVTDAGPATIDGVSVEQYQATLDPAKLEAAMGRVLAQLGQRSGAPSLASALRSLTGSMSADIDSAGRVVIEDCTANATVPLPRVYSSGGASKLALVERVQAHFHDYGAPVSVTPPPAAAVQPQSNAATGLGGISAA